MKEHFVVDGSLLGWNWCGFVVVPWPVTWLHRHRGMTTWFEKLLSAWSRGLVLETPVFRHAEAGVELYCMTRT